MNNFKIIYLSYGELIILNYFSVLVWFSITQWERGLLEQNVKLWLEQGQKAFLVIEPLTSPPYTGKLISLAAVSFAVRYNLAIALL